MTTRSQQTEMPRWLLFFLTAMVAALAAILCFTTASAAASPGAETRVEAFIVTVEPLVGPQKEIAAGQRPGEAAPQPGFVVATGVAANAGTRLRPGVTQPGVTRTLENSLNPDAYISDVVSHYGINLRGSGQSISVQFNPNLASAGRVRAATPNVIEVGPNAFASSEEMARTLAHELNHARSFLRDGAAPESTAFGAEGYLSQWMAGLR